MSTVQVSEGVSKKIIREGGGTQVTRGKTITVHCTGLLAETNAKFWSTKDPGQQPFQFKVGMGEVIAGWDEGCLTMKQGEIASLTVASHKGYGSSGFPAWGIKPNAVLIFEIEILSIR